jgi:hypothetical protein
MIYINFIRMVFYYYLVICWNRTNWNNVNLKFAKEIIKKKSISLSIKFGRVLKISLELTKNRLNKLMKSTHNFVKGVIVNIHCN